MKKKLGLILLTILTVCIIALLTVLPKTEYRSIILGTVEEEKKAASTVGTWDVSENGDGSVTATLNSDGLLTISGTGKMKDFGFSTSTRNPYYSERESITNVIINNGVTSIGKLSFYYCTNLESITIPNSVTSIDEEFVYNCTNLKNFNVDSSNVNYLSDGGILFDKDTRRLVTKLVRYPEGRIDTTYTIPTIITSIGNHAFENCTNLTNIVTNNVTSIGNNAFSGCHKLRSITIPNGVTSIESSTFFDCFQLTSITIPNSVTNIGSYAFCQSGITNITIPSTVTSIGNYAFNNCVNLESITIQNSVTFVGTDIISNSKINSLKLYNPTKEGYTFAGWYDSESGGNLVYAASNTGYIEITKTDNSLSNSKLYAQFTANNDTTSTVTITLNNQGATNAGTTSLTLKYGDGIYNGSNKMTTTSNPITIPRKEYTITLNFNGNEQEDETIIMEDEFLGYYDGETQMINEAGYITSEFTSTKYNSNKTLIAQWEDIHGPLPTTDDDWTEKLEREGYTFEGWYTDEECTDGNKVNSEDYVPTQDITLYAKWTSIGEPPLPEPEVYTITYRNVEDAEFEEDNPTTYTEETEDFTLCNPTREGYTFEGWRGTDIDDIETEVTIEQGSTGNREYEAVWKEIEEEPQPTNTTNTTNTNTSGANTNTNSNSNNSRTNTNGSTSNYSTNRNTSSSSTNRSTSNNSKSNITTKTYGANIDNTTATKVLSKTGSVNILLIISTITAVTLGIILVIKEIQIRE